MTKSINYYCITVNCNILNNNDNHYQLEYTGNDIYLIVNGQVQFGNLLIKSYYLPDLFPSNESVRTF
jgi:hypothetical protein